MPPKDIKKIDEVNWEIPKKESMNVPARIIATKKLLDEMDDGVFTQISNVASLPGIQQYAICHADGHWGYGFPIGGVAAFDPEENGVISPGGVGFDINCGMRACTTNLTYKEIKPKLKELTDYLFKIIPSGVGCKGFVKVNKSQFKEVIELGSKWCIENGYGWDQDLERTELKGRFNWADSSKVSDKAISRGINQLGTLGSGNHYLEIQLVKPQNVFDEEIAKKLGITSSHQITIMVHCGSRGFGHQVATDYLRVFDQAMQKHGLRILDRELSCAPFNSKEGQDYYKAMGCAANMAFVNRQVILHRVREGFSKIFKQEAEDLGLNLIWDCTHNVAVKRTVTIGGKKKELIVHQKGSTKSVGPDHKDLPLVYKDIGVPIIIGGSMQSGSYLLVGTKKAEEETFSTTCHGSGRTMSRTKAKKMIRGDQLQKQMLKEGIYVRATSMQGLAEEAGKAYKEVDEVINSVDKAGVSKKIVKLIPLSNIKG